MSSPSSRTTWLPRLDRAVADGARLLALSLDERAVLLAVLEDPPAGLAELRAVLDNDHQWRRRKGSTDACFEVARLATETVFRFSSF